MILLILDDKISAMKHLKYLLLTAFISLAFLQEESQAQLYLNTDAGIYIPKSEDPQVHPGFLLEARYAVNEYFRVGTNFGYYFYNESNNLIGTYSAFTMPITIVAEVGYDMLEFRPILGVNFGMYRQGATAQNISSSKAYWGMAIAPGFEYKLSETIALNANFKFHNIFYNNNTYKAFGFNAGATFLF